MNQFPPTYGIDPNAPDGGVDGGLGGDMFTPQHGPEFFGYNEVNLFSNGKMGMDPSYASPNWMANMRPQYGGPAGFDARQAPQFTFMGGVRQLGFLPTFNDPVTPSYMSSSTYYGQAAHDVASKPIDYGMNALQNAAIPIMGFMAGTYLSSRNVGGLFGPHKAIKSAHYAASIASQRMSALVTGNAVSSAAMHQTAMAAAGRHSFGAFAGRMVGSGIGRTVGFAAGGIGGSLGGFVAGGTGAGRAVGAAKWGARGAMLGARGLGFAGSMVGAAAGWLALPMLAMEAADQFGDQMANAYIGTRQGMDSLLSASSAEYTGQSMYGTGMNRGVAASLGGRMARESILKGKEGSHLAEILNTGSQMGMYEDVNFANSEQVLSRTRSIAKQVSMLMKVANEPNVQEALKMVGDLQRSGIVGKNAEALITSYGSASAISGVAGRRIMETVGKQGQAMAQMAGMSPFIGQMQAASAYAGIANAAKMGLVDPSTLALMGGVEGATQAFTGGSMRLASTTYNMATSLWGRERGVTGTLAGIGNRVAADPLKARAELFMMGGQAAAKEMEKNIFAPYAQVFDQARILGGGRVTTDGIINVMQSQGMSQAETRSLLAMMQNFQDPASRTRMYEAMTAGNKETMFHTLEQAGLAYTGRGPGAGVFSPVSRTAANVKIWWNEMGGAMANDSAWVSGGIANLGDYLNRKAWGDRWGVGPDVKRYRYVTDKSGETFRVSGGGVRINKDSMEDRGFSASGIALTEQMARLVDTNTDINAEFNTARKGTREQVRKNISGLLTKYMPEAHVTDIAQATQALSTSEMQEVRKENLKTVKADEERRLASATAGAMYTGNDSFFSDWLGYGSDKVQKAADYRIRKGIDQILGREDSIYGKTSNPFLGAWNVVTGGAASVANRTYGVGMMGLPANTFLGDEDYEKTAGLRGDVESYRGSVALYRAGLADNGTGAGVVDLLKNDAAARGVAAQHTGTTTAEVEWYLSGKPGLSKDKQERIAKYTREGVVEQGNAGIAKNFKKGMGKEALISALGISDKDRGTVEEIMSGLNVGAMDAESAGRLASVLPRMLKERERYESSAEYLKAVNVEAGLSDEYTKDEGDDGVYDRQKTKDDVEEEQKKQANRDFRDGAKYLLEFAERQRMGGWTPMGTLPATATGKMPGATNATTGLPGQ